MIPGSLWPRGGKFSQQPRVHLFVDLCTLLPPTEQYDLYGPLTHSPYDLAAGADTPERAPPRRCSQIGNDRIFPFPVVTDLEARVGLEISSVAEGEAVPPGSRAGIHRL